ncbi:MAG TPA: hypothetical protein VFZ66_27975 [Herpetosiphonaceae bacterium]
MRETMRWRDGLMREFEAARVAYGRPSMAPADLLETELILTLLADYLPGEAPDLAWTVLNGHPFPARERLSEAARRAIACVRQHLRAPLGRGTWERWLSEYSTLAEPYPIYRIRNGQIVPVPSTLAPDRCAVMRTTFEKAPPWAVAHPRFASPGAYRFPIDREPFEVEIDGRTAALVQGFAARSVAPSQARPPLDVSLNALRATAHWMDSMLGTDRWATSMDIQLRAVTASGFVPADTLRLDGLCHLIGMLGSGKSTLLTVLAVHFAREGLRVVLVYGDVATLLRELEQYERLHAADARIRAMPLIGRSTRLAHLNRLHAAEHDRGKAGLQLDHAGFAILSTLCPLDGLRPDSRPIPPGQEPCTALVEAPQGDDEEHQPVTCPLLPACPVHQPTRTLLDASIWLATPASLLASSPQSPLIRERMRFIEMVMWSADVVLVDEADMVQAQFDDRFAQTEVLIGRANAWFDRLYAQVARQVYRPGRPLLGRSRPFDRWLAAHNNAQRAADSLLRLLRDDEMLRHWLRASYFTGRRLLQRLAYHLEHEYGRDVALFMEASEVFSHNPLGRTGRPRPSTAWVDAVRLHLLGADHHETRDLVESSLADLVPGIERLHAQVRETLASRLLAALLVTVLDEALRQVITGWSTAEEILDLDKGSGGLFFPPSESVTRMVPEAPTGAILGFQYYDPQDNGQGELRFFRLRGLGRALLYHLHDAFIPTDSVPGPHVLLTSGTSWAPGSWRYHLHRAPDYALLPTRADQTAQTRCFWTFVPDPDPRARGRFLHVSGKSAPQDRINALTAMVRALGHRTTIGGVPRSIFDDEFRKLDSHRQRILLVVGSYQEAEYVEQALSDVLGVAAGEAVVALIPDVDGDLQLRRPQAKLRRSNLARLPELQGVRFLVAPLQAIERGHNILVGQEAAIGSVFFLTRPLPVPGDLHIAIQKINAWAMDAAGTCDLPTVGAAGAWLRAEADRRWRMVSPDGVGQATYRGMSDRTGLLWTQLVLVWQCIGRLLRGGVPARVHFVDAKWAEVRAGLVAGERDTEATSMVVGFHRLLQEALHDPDPAQAAIAEALYGSFAQALQRLIDR